MDSLRDYSKLDRFLERLGGDIYPEVPSEPHLMITKKFITALAQTDLLRVGTRLLDVGCGQGLALEHFAKLGVNATGVTLGVDLEVCRSKGYDAREMDQSFLDFPDEEFDFLWCRHVLEHSIFPFFTLSEYQRVMKKGGHLYIEVPTPDTGCHHETNPNHYSVLGKSMWCSLFQRTGLHLKREGEIGYPSNSGPDVFWYFLLQKPA